MNSKHVLIPVDLMRSPCDALIYARDMAADCALCVTLIYVLNLNIVAPGRQIYDELCAEGEAALRRLARLVFGTDQAVQIVVRVGAPHEEILTEARAHPTDLIVMSGPERRGLKRLLHAGTTQKIIDGAPCPTMVLPRAVQIPAKIRALPTPVEAALAEAI